jgi:RNA polymerase sigma-70 factor (ECF subfamily)
VSAHADLALAEQCRAQVPGAFEEVYRAHAPRLFGLIGRLVGRHEAEDLLQEIFLAAHRKMTSYKGESALGTWLYRLAMNHCLDYLRSRQVRMGRVTESLDGEQTAQPVAHTPAVPAPISRMDLERAIARLPEGCRATFLLHDVEGFEHQEIAQILGIAVGTSKSQVHKARTKLREMLSHRERR